VNKVSNIAATNAVSGPRSIRFSCEWFTRPFFGVLLAFMVIAAIVADKPYLEIVVAAVAFGAAREWHRMVGHGKFGAELVATTATLWFMLIAFMFQSHSFVPKVILVCGTLFVLAISQIRRNNPLWQAGGVLYLGIPSLAIVTLRDVPGHGAWLIAGLFIVVWATDTGALVAGNLIGGPKLAAWLSPNKTWSGTICGIAAAAIMEIIYIAEIGGNASAAALFGVGLAVIAHLGDLFESLVKRLFRTKDSGGLIPGHGGVLDRIDSTLFASVALAITVFVLNLDPLFGAHP
jgi:phosphatidate cytidylyltransferase